MNNMVTHHLLIEIIGSSLLNDAHLVEEFFRELARSYQGEILGLKIHQFEPQGISGLLIMPESHIAIHTWPEYGYASLDIFLQAKWDPQKSVPIIQKFFKPRDVKIIELERGVKKQNGTLVFPKLH